MEIFCYFEEKPVHKIGMLSYPLISIKSIHMNHMDMMKFCGPRDAGYISVKDLLWLWVKSSQGGGGTRIDFPEVRNKRIQHFGPTYSGGGPVLQGTNSAGRDMNIENAAQATRCFILGFTLCRSLIRLWVFGRLGSIASEQFDINKNGLRFVSTILGFLWMSEEELGFDPTIKIGKGPTIHRDRIGGYD
ncbi:uncharacterized protein B0T15DRAFT_573290 [Chaetomium strumarium]|uniref:Fungal-type protein kinase domain-containing protein n=1 Tax=Chaetomium strumarium TaxID=1170767 RepID=A0AAJ0GZZ0_9PEZI|nr:hypothetical protein B0T15DRAFT_573290 [Chaetomium strumarium]